MKFILIVLFVLFNIGCACTRMQCTPDAQKPFDSTKLTMPDPVLHKHRMLKIPSIFKHKRVVVYLNFNGDYIKDFVGCYPFAVTDAHLTDEQIKETVAVVQEDFSPFNVCITTDEKVWSRTPATDRIKVIITTDSYLEPNLGGRTYYYLGTNTSMHALVFPDRCMFSPLFIGGATSHEIGHTLGLKHQSLYNRHEKLLDVYNPGDSLSGPIMGFPVKCKFALWANGPTMWGSDDYQNDVEQLTSVLGLKKDDCANHRSRAKRIHSTYRGVISYSGDVDWVKYHGSGTLSLHSFGNTVLKMRVFTKYGELKVQEDNTIALPFNDTMYWISVQTTPYKTVPQEFMLGQWELEVSK